MAQIKKKETPTQRKARLNRAKKVREDNKSKQAKDQAEALQKRS
mgnify:CR=1 FL=1